MHDYTQVYMHAYIYVYRYVGFDTPLHAGLHTCLHMLTHMFTHMFTCMFTHVVHALLHTLTHMFTQKVTNMLIHMFTLFVFCLIQPPIHIWALFYLYGCIQKANFPNLSATAVESYYYQAKLHHPERFMIWAACVPCQGTKCPVELDIGLSNRRKRLAEFSFISNFSTIVK